MNITPQPVELTLWLLCTVFLENDPGQNEWHELFLTRAAAVHAMHREIRHTIEAMHDTNWAHTNDPIVIKIGPLFDHPEDEEKLIAMYEEISNQKRSCYIEELKVTLA